MPPKSTKSATEAVKPAESKRTSEDPLPEPKFKHINICIENYENIKPFFPVAEIQTTIYYDDNVIGSTTPILILDDDLISVNQNFNFTVNLNNPKELDTLVSLPLTFHVSQIQGPIDNGFFSQIQITKAIPNVPCTKSFDSVISIYEAFTGRKIEISEDTKNKIKRKKSGKAEKKKNKAPKKLKSESKTGSEKSGSIKSKSSSASRMNNKSINYDPIPFGMCCLDILPVISESLKFSQTLLIKPVVQYKDNKMLSFKAHPKITVTVFVEDDLDLPEPTFLNFTLETIYNIPAVMKPEMDYWACMLLPMLNGRKSPLLFRNPATVSETKQPISKLWPGTTRAYDDANSSSYMTSGHYQDLICHFDTNFETYISEESPRLQFVMVKRHLMFKDATLELINHIQVYKKLVLEIYMVPKEKTKKGSSNLLAKSLDFPRKIRKGGEYLHLMAILDVAALLYPGVQQVRLAAPITTFSPDEAAKCGGLPDSYFLPTLTRESKEKEPRDREPRENASKKDNKSGKGSKSSKGKSKERKNMKDALPPKPVPPPEPEPSMPVYNENGKPCFVVVEFELSTPLVPAKKIDDVKEDLSLLIKEKQKISALNPISVLTTCMNFDYYKEVLNAMILDLNEKFLTFVEENPLSPERKETSEETAKRFVDFLKYEGIYDSYVQSITKATCLLISKNFQLVNEEDTKEYQKFIGNVFISLISKMNKTVNQVMCQEMQPGTALRKTDNFFFYAKEAMDTNRPKMAEKYLIERLCNDPRNADYWFDYGLYFLEEKEDDKAYECMKEALLQQQQHKYCLIVLAVLLSNKGHKEDAETCFLNIVTENCEWCEAWTIFYLFYQKSANFGGMDNTLGMAKKYSDVSAPADHFSEYEDLVWTGKICPKSIFFRAAALLLKLRLYSWTELALAQEINHHPGFAHYLLSAVSYYKRLYRHALDHIEEALKHYGPHYEVSSLAGHCLFALDRYGDAKKQYYYALESFDRPVHLHLVTVNLAQILMQQNADQEARKLILLACKYNPSPFSWCIAGKLYLEQNDFLSAEECFSEANAMDNTYAEIWGYLALVNFKLQRHHEAELCLNQAMKNKLSDQDLLELIKNEICSNNSMMPI